MSVALNIAEGSRLHGGHARMRFQTAMGSADEIAQAVGYIEAQPDLIDLFDKVARTMNRMSR